MGWSILIGASGGVLVNYPSYFDFEFYDPLYDFGVANIILTGLRGNPAPAQGNVLKIVWDRGLASEQVHWQGFVSQVQTKQQGNVYVLRCFTLDALLQVGQTGAVRNYLALTPHQIIQAAGSPSPLIVDQQGTTRITYGTAASVPNKVDGANPGTALTQFVTDATTLFNNMRRLCHQARYDGASYGLEWTTTLEGANGSSPRFYLVKRRERAAAYTAETYDIPDDFVNARRGSDLFPGVDAVKVIGGGNGLGGTGSTRVESALVGAGTRESIVVDKAILQTTNATNLANRILGIFGSTIEVVAGDTLRHASPTRSGDNITVTQTGKAPLTTRVVMRHYRLGARTFTFICGRPEPIGRDKTEAIASLQKQDTTVPQVTEVKPDVLRASSTFVRLIPSAPRPVAAGATVTVFDSNTDLVLGSLAELGLAEALWMFMELVVTAADVTDDNGHSLTYDKTTGVTIGTANSGNAGADPHGHSATPTHTVTPVAGTINPPLIAGPFQVDVTLFFNSRGSVRILSRILPHLRVAAAGYRDSGTYPFAASDPNPPADDFTPTRITVDIRNDGVAPFSITLGTGSLFEVARNDLHRHNSLT